MIYVFDTSSFIVLENFYPEAFPSFWEQLDSLVEDDRLVSVSEVYKELQTDLTTDFLLDWVEKRKVIFSIPTAAETVAVSAIFAVQHFTQLISEKQRVRGTPVADPWVVARGRVLPGCVVTEERMKPNAAKIPNVCAHFGVECLSLRDALAREGMRF